MTAPLTLGRVVATPGALNLLSEMGKDPFGYITPAMPQGTGETSAPSTAVRTRSLCARGCASSPPTRPRRGAAGSSQRQTAL